MQNRHGKARPTRPVPEKEVLQKHPSEPTLFSLQMQMGGDNTRLARWEWVCLAMLIAIAAALRFWRLGDPSFWCDESGSVRFGLCPIGDILACRMEVASPPVHLVLIHYALMLFGVSEWTARLPCAIFGVALIPAQYLLARMLCGRRIAVLSSLFICLSAYQIYYSRDAHGYSVYAFLSWLSLYFFFRILFSDGAKLRHWFGYSAACVLLVASHFMGAVACLGQGIIGLAFLATRVWKRYPWNITRRMIAGFTCSAIAVAAVLAFYMRQIGTILSGDSPLIPGSQLLRVDFHLLYHLATRQGFGNSLGLALFVFLMVAGLIYMTGRSRIAAIVLVLWLVFPYALTATIDLGATPMPRYNIFAYPSIAILAGCGICATINIGLRLSRGRWWGYSATLPIVLLWAIAMIPAYRDYYSITANDWPKRDVAKWINENTPEESIILFMNVYELRWIGPNGYKIPNRTFAYLGICEPKTQLRFRAFLEKYPEVAFVHLGDMPNWTKQIHGQRETFTNVHGEYLARRGLYNTTDYDGVPDEKDLTRLGQISASVTYNTEDDLILKAREAKRPTFRRLVKGFGFWLNPQDGRDWMTATGTAQVAVYQLDSAPRPVVLKVRAVGIGADKIEVANPDGPIGSLQIVQNELREYSLSISNLPPGRTMLTFKVGGQARSTNGQPPVILFDNITAE